MIAASIVSLSREKAVSHPPLFLKRLQLPGLKHLELSGVLFDQQMERFVLYHGAGIVSLSIQMTNADSMIFMMNQLHLFEKLENLSIFDYSNNYQKQVSSGRFKELYKANFEP